MFQKADGGYSDEMKRFAATRKFYSAKAYDFVKDELKLPLPSKRSIYRWLSCISGKPGFAEEAWKLMANRLQGDDAYRYKTCVLMLDHHHHHLFGRKQKTGNSSCNRHAGNTRLGSQHLQ